MLNYSIWNNYRDFFPHKYWKWGKFDDIVEQTIQNRKPENALDIGGGVFGSDVLKKSNVTSDLLDPYINVKPNWMNNLTKWNNDKKYDLVICRGAINYLTKEEIALIPTFISSGGIFLANTFLDKPSDVKTSFFTADNGLKGVEKAYFENGLIKHELNFADFSIHHQFFYYSKNDYQLFFKNVEFKQYGTNSFCLVLKE